MRRPLLLLAATALALSAAGPALADKDKHKNKNKHAGYELQYRSNKDVIPESVVTAAGVIVLYDQLQRHGAPALVVLEKNKGKHKDKGAAFGGYSYWGPVILIDSGKNKNKNKGYEQQYQSNGNAVLNAAITAAEIAIIYDYIQRYGTAGFGPPQGLPPGIAKNLARGKPLPPGIAKRYLPQPLLGQLPARPGYEWRVVDNDILLVVAATSVIVDLLQGAF